MPDATLALSITVANSKANMMKQPRQQSAPAVDAVYHAIESHQPLCVRGERLGRFATKNV